jgi:hypothetical protein
MFYKLLFVSRYLLLFECLAYISIVSGNGAKIYASEEQNIKKNRNDDTQNCRIFVRGPSYIFVKILRLTEKSRLATKQYHQTTKKLANDNLWRKLFSKRDQTLEQCKGLMQRHCAIIRVLNIKKTTERKMTNKIRK